jgi:hypothetical protein
MDITYLGETNWRNEQKRFGIKRDDRRGHLLIIGKTGVGKSTLLANMILSDIYAGNGLAVIDPHGALVEETILPYIPDRRVEDVIYMNPANEKGVVPFNLLEQVDPRYHALVVSGIISIFKKIWFDAWGPRLEHVLRHCLLTLMRVTGSTLLDVSPLLIDEMYRNQILVAIDDESLQRFWRKEFLAYSPQYRAEAVGPILNKIGVLSGNAMLKRVIGQPQNTFEMRRVMDEGNILLVNLSKGRLGEDASSLLGAFVITKIWLTALGRQNVSEQKRKDFFLHIDEAHSITGHFASMLSETRKYHVNATLAFQYFGQLEAQVRDALLGNVGTLISFRVGADDAAYLAREFYPVFTEADFVNLPQYHMYLKLLIDGVPSQGFSARSLSPEMMETGNAEQITNFSRQIHFR